MRLAHSTWIGKKGSEIEFFERIFARNSVWLVSLEPF